MPKAAIALEVLPAGYIAFDWGQGFNTGPKGDLDTWLHNVKSQVVDRLATFKQPAILIGWSLGGLYAREIAKLMAPRIRQVITLGTPFNSHADHTNVGWLFRLLSGKSSKMDPALSLRLRTPPPLRTTSIYSRYGAGRVASGPRACVAWCANNRWRPWRPRSPRMVIARLGR